MLLRRRVATFFCNCVGLTAPLVHDRFGHAHRTQAGGDAVVGAEHDRFLDHRARRAGQTTGSLQHLMPASHDFPQGRRMIEPTQEIRLGCRNLGKGGELEVPQIKEKQRVRPR